MPHSFPRNPLLALLLASLLSAPALAREQVVIYTALDREYSEPILKQFENRTGIEVLPVYDTESVKTVGLVNRLLTERNRPACDVFWNNEIIRSLRLKREGITEPYESPSAAAIPAEMKDPAHHWTGFAARARVIIINTKLLPDKARWPTTFDALAEPRWKGRTCFGRPLFGSTATHAAILFSERGETSAAKFWTTVHANAIEESGNAQVRDAVAAGEMAWGVTDSDDAHGALDDGKPVAIVYGDAQTSGVIMIPNTLCLIKGAPHPANARKLIDYLLSPDVEATLASGRSAQVPVRHGIAPPVGIPSLEGLRIRHIDWEAAEKSLDSSQKQITTIFQVQ